MGTIESSRWDHLSLSVMLGRDPRGSWRVASRCHLGLPAVIENAPLLTRHEPFPTTYWLTCPLAVRRTYELESSGWMADLNACVDVSQADRAYERERDAAVAEMRRRGEISDDVPVPSGGVGGAHGGIKCLHARYAYWRAGGDDPAGAATAERIEPFECAKSCVETGKVEIKLATSSARES